MLPPRARRLPLLGLLSVGLPVLALVGAVGPGAPTARAETLTDLERRHAELKKRVEGWLALALRDPRRDQLEEYSRYVEADFKNPKRAVKASHVVAMLADVKADKELRLDAAKVLKGAATTTQDPELSLTKRGTRTPRRAWAQQNLLELLDDKDGDRISRRNANEILSTWFYGELDARAKRDVDAFDADKDKTWKDARKAWFDLLSRG